MAGYLNLPPSTLAYLVSKYEKAVSGFQAEVKIFVAENLALGITNSGKVKLISDTLKDVNYYGSTGSLYQALEALNKVKVTPEMAPYLTEDRLNYLKNRLIAILSGL